SACVVRSVDCATPLAVSERSARTPPRAARRRSACLARTRYVMPRSLPNPSKRSGETAASVRVLAATPTSIRSDCPDARICARAVTAPNIKLQPAATAVVQRNITTDSARGNARRGGNGRAMAAWIVLCPARLNRRARRARGNSRSKSPSKSPSNSRSRDGAPIRCEPRSAFERCRRRRCTSCRGFRRAATAVAAAVQSEIGGVMQHRAARAERATIALFAIASLLAACSSDITNNVPTVNSFNETRLVADKAAGGAATIDAKLVNPWGLTFSSNGILWASDNGSGVSTLYNADGTALPTVFPVVGLGNGGVGTPTGVIFNSSTNFVIPGFGPASFIFAGIDGTIAASNPSSARALIVANRSAQTAEYTGIAMASSAGATFVYATNFRHNQIDMFDANFQFVRSFTDSSMAADFAPFGIANIGGQLWVTFAKQEGGAGGTQDEPGVGNGFIDVFN